MIRQDRGCYRHPGFPRRYPVRPLVETTRIITYPLKDFLLIIRKTEPLTGLVVRQRLSDYTRSLGMMWQIKLIQV